MEVFLLAAALFHALNGIRIGDWEIGPCGFQKTPIA
jgi:succinate dehydrogenase/fumarate reductase cytochrome b subunit